MKTYSNIKYIILMFFALISGLGCSKLDSKLNSTLTTSQAASSLGVAGAQLLLNGAYSDMAGIWGGQDMLYSLEENTADESLVPTRGGDWDDNGVWRVLHSHKWDADHSQVLNVFNALNKLNFDATNVLSFGPDAGQAAQAKVLRAYALFYLLDLYGQYPVRNPGDNLLLAPEVKSGVEAASFIISEITAALPDLPDFSGTNNNIFNKDAANVLLMRALMQKGTFVNRANPTFDPADMAQVVTIGTAIMSKGSYSYERNYFDNFSPNNHSSKEAIFQYVNTGGASAGHLPVETRWNMTLHYNSWNKLAPNAGWNGFSTISDFYNSFGATTGTSDANRVNGFFTGVGAGNNKDTLLDSRLGGRDSSNITSTETSGIRPGFLIGQQIDEDSVNQKDRKGNPLAFDPVIAPDMKENGANLEVTGIRVIKYVPDYNFYGGPANNNYMLIRYPEVVLMVAEAKLRINAGDASALTMVNDLRSARKAAPLPNLTLVNPSNLYDVNTLLAEWGREFYWEGRRRMDLQRFGVYNKIWQYKPSDDPKYLLFPVPSQALAANPNLSQNPGY
ncbi:MAG: RagB/SusD family nutrient uptake outer membrane protein [Chitinophagaceae bacterium]|nr:RagB/SusD family nutrient uptake outer membrane protein [Chitinophagaceae bacterium]